MIRRFPLHHVAIIATSTSLMMATVYSIIVPEAGHLSTTKFVFPTKISLPGWSFTDSQSSEIETLPENKSQGLIKGGKEYKFNHQNKSLDINSYYLSNTRGNVQHLLKENLKIDDQTLANIQIKRSNQNYYGLFQDQDRTYLSTCLNPFGYSTFTQRQFSQNLNSRQLNLQLIGNWLRGKDSIRDRRCLWTVMSIPNQQETSQNLHQTLEQTWKDYHQWLQPRFPPL